MTNKPREPNYETQRCGLREDCSKLNHDFKLVSSSLQVANEKIRRLELALQKCKEQRGICTEIHANGLCRYQIMEKELESTLEGE